MEECFARENDGESGRRGAGENRTLTTEIGESSRCPVLLLPLAPSPCLPFDLHPFRPFFFRWAGSTGGITPGFRSDVIAEPSASEKLSPRTAAAVGPMSIILAIGTRVPTLALAP